MSKQLSFDGKGINDNDVYRSRIATFTNEDKANTYGKLFAASPELLNTLRDISLAMHNDCMKKPMLWLAAIDNVIANATE